MVRIFQTALAMFLALSSTEAFSVSGNINVKSSLAFVATPSSSAQPASTLPSPLLSRISPVSKTKNVVRMSAAADQEAKPSILVRKPDSSVEITITAPGKATKGAYEKACAEASKSISIPGFRKGAKIPPAVIENVMTQKGGGKNALKTQAIQSLINQLLEPAIKEEHNLEPLGQPSLVTPAEILAENFKAGEDLELIIRCDVWPDIQWKEVEGQEKPYHNLKGSYKRKPFNQERYETALRDLCERYAVSDPAGEDHELEMGDACVVNMDGYMAKENGSKGEPLPNAASGDNVDIILGKGRYMDGLVEGIIGAKQGDTRTVTVTFPTGLKDKTLAGKDAVFDVTILESSIRSVPELSDNLANDIRPGMNAEGIKDELRKAVDDNESTEWVDSRNKAIATALAEIMDVEVPDTLVTNQAREKYAQMMAEFRDQGMADDEIKKLITPENFLKYKNIEKPDIVRDFKISMATDEIARLEGIEVPSYQVEEQLEAIKKENANMVDSEDFDETLMRSKIESTLMRRMVYDYLADVSNLTIEYEENKEGQFDAELMERLAQESLEREKVEIEAEDVVDLEQEDKVETVAEVAAVEEIETEDATIVEDESADQFEELSNETSTVEKVEIKDEKYKDMDPEEKAFNILLDLGMVDSTPDPSSPDYDNSHDNEIVG
mmetsp:Transcript_951/g.1436  ORF Transcript_951/g.1436 Transcript_951/m.1436 type:complete len:667 (+) Transcript_951:32-2032(+)